MLSRFLNCIQINTALLSFEHNFLNTRRVTSTNYLFSTIILGRIGKLGLKISGGRDRPVVPGDPGIFITTVKRGSLLHKVLGPGDKILKVQY